MSDSCQRYVRNGAAHDPLNHTKSHENAPIDFVLDSCAFVDRSLPFLFQQPARELAEETPNLRSRFTFVASFGELNQGRPSVD